MQIKNKQHTKNPKQNHSLAVAGRHAFYCETLFRRIDNDWPSSFAEAGLEIEIQKQVALVNSDVYV